MSLKKTIPGALVGLALEGGLLVLAHRMGWINLKRLDWRNWLIWALFFAGFISACWMVLWLKFINKIFSSKEKKQSSGVTAPSNSPATRMMVQPPARMTVQNNAVLSVSPQTQQPAGENAINQTTAPVTSTTPVPLKPSQPTSQKHQDILELTRVGDDLDMMAFKYVALDGKVIDLVYSSDDIAVLCKVFSEEHHWTVDTTQPIESCVWKNETGTPQNPCMDILNQAAILERMESGATIIPTLVLVRGSIENVTEVSSYLEKNQIHLVKYNALSTDDVQDLLQLLKEKFTLVPDEENEEDLEIQENNAINNLSSTDQT